MIYPTIDKDGSIDEYNLLKELPLQVKIVSIGDKGNFELKKFTYQLNEKIVITKVLVSVDFFREMNDNDARKHAVEKFIQKHSAWLFSYGRRWKKGRKK